MSVEVTGVNALLDQIKKKYDQANVNRITDNTLIMGTKAYERRIKENFESFKDTGASIDEVTHTKPYFTHKNFKQITVYWKGPMNRYAIIHLNEWGTVKNPNPRGKGKLLKTEREVKKRYLDKVKEELRKAL